MKIALINQETTEPTFLRRGLEARGFEVTIHRADTVTGLTRAEAEVAIFLGQKDYTQLISKVEDEGIFCIDSSGSFAADSSVPIWLFSSKPLRQGMKLVSLPNPHLSFYGDLLRRIQNRYPMKRLILLIHSPKESLDSLEQEHSLIEQTENLLGSADLRVNANIVSEPTLPRTDYFLHLEFLKPFNLEMIETMRQVSSEQMVHRSDAVIIQRIDRDLSVDSGLFIHLQAGDLEEIKLHNILSLLNEYQKM